MPNWCTNFMTFMSNGSKEGDNAIQDFNNKIIECIEKKGCKHSIDGCLIWEVELEEYLLGSDQAIPTAFKRGYIENITTVEFNNFHITTQDAWSANNAFWFFLLNKLYGELITFTFVSSEPGMGLYYTNDKGLLPRYNVNIYAEGIENLMNIPSVFIGDSLFKELNIENPYVDFGFGDRIPSFQMEYEGDENEIINECEEYMFGRDIPIKNINDLEKCVQDLNLDISINEYNYVPVRDEVISAMIYDQYLQQKENENNATKSGGIQ